MKVKTSELIGSALDWAVAVCDGYECQFEDEVSGPWLVPQEGFLHDEKSLSQYSPSTSWSQGGALVERESITLRVNANVPGRWVAFIDFGSSNCNIKARQSGPTPLVAAMRCFCCATLGDEIEIPQELQLCQQPNL